MFLYGKCGIESSFGLQLFEDTGAFESHISLILGLELVSALAAKIARNYQ